MDTVVYIHGKGGGPEEAEHYKPLFPEWYVIGVSYQGDTPWEAGKEIYDAIAQLSSKHDILILISNSIGAYFSMNAEIGKLVAHAYFISPIVDMEKLITDMMGWVGITEPELQKRGRIHTAFGEDLSWEYLCYVRQHPVSWNVPTDILYGSEDNLTSIDTITAFAQTHNASLTIMDKGEHWFHTEEQMQFLDNWITKKLDS